MATAWLVSAGRANAGCVVIEVTSSIVRDPGRLVALADAALRQRAS
jgi:hypothetical protein